MAGPPLLRSVAMTTEQPGDDGLSPGSGQIGADQAIDVDSDADLLRHHAAGQAAAFGQLYDRHDRRCLDFIRRMLGSADDASAEDLHQEVWIAVARQAASFDPHKARFVTWLFTIARHKLVDHLRHRAGPVVLAADLGEPGEALLASHPAAANLGPEAIANNRQLAAALLLQVQALPLVQRETFVLFAQHGLGLDEVAAVTQVGLETAKSRLRYARSALRLGLAQWSDAHA